MGAVNTTTANVTKLFIENQTMHFIPVKLKEYFPKITEIQIVNSQLKEVAKEDLESFRDLKVLRIVGNDIEEIKADLFYGHSRNILREIDLSDNQIKSIAKNSFKNLNKLEVINLENNKCINEKFTTNASLNTNASDEASKVLETKCDFMDYLSIENKEVRARLEVLEKKYGEVR